MDAWQWALYADGEELGRFQGVRGLYREEVSFADAPADRLVLSFGQLSDQGGSLSNWIQPERCYLSRSA